MRLYRRSTSYFLTLILVILNIGGVAAAEQIRARGLGIPFEGTPGPLNAITDIAGVEVGQSDDH
jgi:D-aminopeptidase